MPRDDVPSIGVDVFNSERQWMLKSLATLLGDPLIPISIRRMVVAETISAVRQIAALAGVNNA